MKRLLVSAVAVSLFPISSQAADMPPIRAGLWEVKVDVDGESQGTIKQCVDADTAQNMLNAGQKMMGKSCSEVQMSREGAAYVSTVNCNLGVSKMESTTKLSGDFNSKYTSETMTKFNPPMMGQDTSVSKSVGTWVGPCEDGMRAGDTIMPDGQKMNVLDMMDKMPDMSQLQGLAQGAGSGEMNMEELQKSMQKMQEMQKQMEQAMPKGGQ